MRWTGIVEFRLVTADLDRLAAFYQAIGFSVGPPTEISQEEMWLLGLKGTGRRKALRLGRSRLSLDSFDPPGAPYPMGTAAADLVFQHLAMVTDDAAADWIRARAAGATAISRHGPVTLPASAGGVTAVKFRDPDGHPLELLQFPPGSNPDWSGTGLMGIDHSAMSVSDVGVSRRFFAEHGLAEGRTSLNQGPTQVALDGPGQRVRRHRADEALERPTACRAARLPAPDRSGPRGARVKRRRGDSHRVAGARRRAAAWSRRPSAPAQPVRSMASRYWVAVMNSRRPSAPPNARFDATAGRGMKPSFVRSAAQT